MCFSYRSQIVISHGRADPTLVATSPPTVRLGVDRLAEAGYSVQTLYILYLRN